MKSYFSLKNNTKCLVLSLTLINPSILSNLIRKGLAATRLLYEINQTKIFLDDFSSIEILARSKSSKRLDLNLCFC